MRFILFIGLLLINSISLANKQQAVKGEFRLELPKQFAAAQVLFVLTEIGKERSKRAIAYQTEILKDGQKIPIILQYDPAKINLENQYNIDVFVRELSDKQKLIAKYSSPILSSDISEKQILIVLKVPPEPVD